MEKTEKQCLSCQRPFIPRRNPSQNYCPQQNCQNLRKRIWRQHKRIADPDYRENQQRANQAWQKKHKDYWQRYRATHLEYAERNRLQQQKRDQNRRDKRESVLLSSHLAKSDALTLQNPIKSGTYRLIPVTEPLLAKSDAFVVKISLVSSG